MVNDGAVMLPDAAAEIRAALDAGLNVQALDLARTAASGAADAPEIRYLAALACTRMDALDDAEAWLAPIDRAGLASAPLAIEVWSLAGRIAKARFASERERAGPAAADLARGAIGAYRHAFSLTGAAYPAVNAATIASLIGMRDTALALARCALEALPVPADHWDHASVGEALLILGDADAARKHYAEAFRLAGNRFGDVASMRRQLLLIGSDAALDLLRVLPAPRVIAFSGHMIDRADRPVARFPAAAEARVAAALRARIAELGPSIGFAQAACGGDILFLEALQDTGAQTQIVLPFAAAHYVATSVAFAGTGWTQRFERAVARATRVVVATDEAFLGDDVLYTHAANLIQGMAFLRARELATQPLMLTLRDDAAAQVRMGGTTATMRAWAARGGRVENIDLAALRADALHDDVPREPVAGESGVQPVATTVTTPPAHSRHLMSLLFADVSGFSRISEDCAPAFAEMFLGTCKRILDALEHEPAVVTTQGDGVFLAFDAPSHAATFAVLMQAALAGVDWRALGLATATGARIGLHTGPVFRILDPVTERPTCYGTHVNRAARLEPIVQPRSILATEAFAASLVAENDTGFRCDYVGAMQLAKNFGESRLYRIRAADSR